MLTLHLGDALNVARTFGVNTFDAIVTDPPYSAGGGATFVPNHYLLPLSILELKQIAHFLISSATTSINVRGLTS